MIRPLSSIYQRLKLLRWKIYTIIDGSKLRTFNISGLFQVDYPLRSEVGKQLFFGKFELEEVAFLKTILHQGDIVLDLGANAGIYSILASLLTGPFGRVYAFEIGPKEIKLFKHNIAKSSVKNVVLLEYAVSNASGQAEFAISQDGAMNSLAKNDHPHQLIKEWLTVETITLNDFAKRYNIQQVDVIKMDVEGAEKLVFEGGLEVLKRWKPRYIIFEASDLTAKAFGYTVSEFIAYLIQNNFVVYALDGGKLVSINGESTHRPDRYNFVAVPR